MTDSGGLWTYDRIAQVIKANLRCGSCSPLCPTCNPKPNGGGK